MNLFLFMKKSFPVIVVSSLLFFLSFSVSALAAEANVPLTKYQALEKIFGYFDIQIDDKYRGATPAFQQYWTDIWPSNEYYGLVNTACERKVVTCDVNAFFNGEQELSLAAFLKMFYTLQWEKTPELLQARQTVFADQPWYTPYLNEAVTTGLIDPDTTIGSFTAEQAREIFRRDTLLRFYDGLVAGYFSGLETDVSRINSDTYYRLDKTRQTLDTYNAIIDAAEVKIVRLREEKKDDKILTMKLARLIAARDAFSQVVSTLELNPLLYDPTLPEEIKATVQEFGMREKIGESVYDFSKSPSYRRNNIKIALKKINGMVLQPGQEFNFATVIYDKGLRDFQLGWVINKGKEEQAVGGGICGAATTIFEAAYRSGLQITERREHTIFYKSFYPMDKIGLDAAVYSPRPNLRFVNNTGAPIVLYLNYTSDFVANLQILGNKHYDEVTLEGPNLVGTRAKWVRTIRYKDGNTSVEELVSRFNKIK